MIGFSISRTLFFSKGGEIELGSLFACEKGKKVACPYKVALLMTVVGNQLSFECYSWVRNPGSGRSIFAVCLEVLHKRPEFLSPSHMCSPAGLFSQLEWGQPPKKENAASVRTNRTEKGERKRGVDFQRNFRIHPPSAAHRTTS